MRRKGIDDEQARNIEHVLMLKHAQDWLNNNQKTNSKSLAETIVHARTGATALHVACAKGYLDVIEYVERLCVRKFSIEILFLLKNLIVF